MDNVLDVVEQEESAFSSRRAALLMGGAALAGFALTRKSIAQTTTSSTPSVADIFNFALNLEYLEAQFYAYATTGAAYTGTTSGVGTTGTVTVKSSSTMVPFTTPGLQDFAMELAQDEANHVAFLQGALNPSGGTAAAVAMPNIDLMNSFNTLAMAAGIGQTFDPFASELNFLIGAFIFEDVGVTAYQGAAPYLMNGQNGLTTGSYLDYALGIHGVEAYHAGSIRQRIYNRGGSEPMLSMSVANLRATLDGSTAAGAPDDIGVSVTTVNGVQATTLVDTSIANGMLSNNGMTFARTTTQVLDIVYGGGAVGTGGLFFPQGMNGTIR